MKRIRMVGDYELVYEKEMNMYRVKKIETEDFSSWINSEKGEDLKKIDEDEFFLAAEELFTKE